MSASALALALGAAALHAAWNVLLARAGDVRAATTVALGLSVVLFAPVAVATWDVEAAAAPWIAASAALELAYFLLLTTACRRSDLSLVYPISRGVAPVLVLVGATATGSALGVWGALGVLLVGIGVVLVRGVRRPVDTPGLLLALAIAATIAGYTLVDKEGIEHASPIAYLELVLGPVALAAVGRQLVGRRRARSAPRRGRNRRSRGLLVRRVRARPGSALARSCRRGGRRSRDEHPVRGRACGRRAPRAGRRVSRRRGGARGRGRCTRRYGLTHSGLIAALRRGPD